MKILLATFANPASEWLYYEKAFAKISELITFGPTISKADFDYSKNLMFEHHRFIERDIIEKYHQNLANSVKEKNIVTNSGQVDLKLVLKQLPEFWTPDFFVWTDHYAHILPFNLELLSCPKIALLGDIHLNLELRLDFLTNFDLICSPFANYLVFLRKFFPKKKIIWLPLAFDSEIYYRKNTEKVYDFAFVGSTNEQRYPERNRILQNIYQSKFKSIITLALREEANEIYNESLMVFNHSLNDALGTRFFEVLGSGSLLLTNRLSDNSKLADLFTENVHYCAFSANDWRHQIIHFLKNPKELEKIALAGHKLAVEKHTYDHRVRELISNVYSG